jgi:hypothetical protein
MSEHRLASQAFLFGDQCQNDNVLFLHMDIGVSGIVISVFVRSELRIPAGRGHVRLGLREQCQMVVRWRLPSHNILHSRIFRVFLSLEDFRYRQDSVAPDGHDGAFSDTDTSSFIKWPYTDKPTTLATG